ncbi:MAG TPA: AAA family ATPase [Actinopolymorphaceae bacterium]
MVGSAPAPLVILLSGPSSSGKTSLARALQSRLSTPALLLEADRVFPAVPSHWPPEGRSHADLVLAFHRSIAVWAESGFDVIVDGSLPYEDRRLRDDCLDVLSPYDLRVIGVRCSETELTRREAVRPERRPRGWAVRQARDIHDGMRYAVEIDTTGKSPEAGADEVVSRLGMAAER